MFKIKIISPIHGSPYVERESQAEVDAYINDPEILAHWGEGTVYIVEDVSAQVEQEAVNKEALEYLASTDWMVLRAQEDASKPVPEEVALARQAARERIVR